MACDRRDMNNAPFEYNSSKGTLSHLTFVNTQTRVVSHLLIQATRPIIVVGN
jgi:hypothetical protein